MRTPNTKCSICGKPLYRRPSEFKWKAFCCKEHRSELYKKREPSPNLKLGRQKGTNHRNGIPQSETMKNKMRIKMKEWCRKNPEKVKDRGLKTRGENHYNWKGGITSLQFAIRTCTESLKWIKAVFKKDNYKCQICKSIKKLEAHHKEGIAKMIKEYKIKTLDEANQCKELWDISNGIVLCRKCHYKIHGKKYED